VGPGVPDGSLTLSMNSISFSGEIGDGVGKYVELHVPGREELTQAPSDWPVTLQKGSLNVRIAALGYPPLFAALGLPNRVRSLDLRPFPSAFEIAQHEFGNNRLKAEPSMPHKGSAQVWRAILATQGDKHPCWVLRRYGSGVGEQLELLSERHMRSAFQLATGQPVIVALQRGDMHACLDELK
jgi:hypothetical protein